MALSLLASVENRDVDLAAVSAIEALLAEAEVPWWIPDALRLVFRRFGDPDPDKRLGSIGKDFEEFDSDEVRRIWREARAALKIPKVTPARIPEMPVYGVGSNTPS